MPFLDEDGVTRLTEDYLDIFAPKEELGEGDGTNVGPIYELSAKGHAEQFSTSGKNLLPATLSSVKAANTSGTWNDNVYTLNGLTAIVSNDMRIKLSGTVSAGSNLFVCLGLVLASGTYTLSMTDSLTNAYFRVYDGSKVLANITNESRSTFTISESKTVSVFFNATDTSNAVSFDGYVQLEAGSTATEYEPYTGGAPSPSPDYPQEIQVVRGRNLLGFEDYTAYASSGVNGLTFSIINSVITINGTATQQTDLFYAIDMLKDIEIKAGQSYTLSYNGILSSSANLRIFLGNTSSWPLNTYSLPYTFTPSEDLVIKNMLIRVPANATVNVKGVFQLTLGSTPQPYVPYGYVGMEVQGKNLLDFGETYSGSGYVFGTKYYPISLSAGTYTFSWWQELERESSKQQVLALHNSGTRLDEKVFNVAKGLNTCTLTIDDDANKLEFFINQTFIVSNFICAKGSTATKYEPYYHSTTPIPLPDRGWVAGLRDDMTDTLTLDGAGKCKWELETRMLKGSEMTGLTLNGLAADTTGFGGTDTRCGYYFAGELFDHSNKFKILGQHQPLLCDHLLYANKSLYNKDIVGINIYATDAANNNYLEIRVSDSLLTQYGSDLSTTANNKNAFKAWLADSDLEIIVCVQNPTIEDCGYIEDWPTDIPEGATITIPELDALNVKYFVANDSISQYAEQWYERTKAVNIDPVEDAVGDLTSVVANLVTHDQFYFGYDEVNGKKMISIFKRGDI